MKNISSATPLHHHYFST